MMNETLNIVLTGHVDHGKSTILGRLLADTGNMPAGKHEELLESCRRHNMSFEYAYLVDALKDERFRGITLDTARVFMRTEKRNYLFLDAPGHVELVRNMMTGASRADAALIVLDAAEGIRENSRRHAYLLSMLGIKQVIVVINKMDRMGYDKSVFDKIKNDYRDFLARTGIEPLHYIPAGGTRGDNVASCSSAMPWYGGKTILDALEDVSVCEPRDSETFRMPVQDVYDVNEPGRARRIIAGTVVSGRIATGDRVIVYPVSRSARVNSVEFYGRPGTKILSAGCAAGIVCDGNPDVRRGDIMARKGEKPPGVSDRLQVRFIWLGKGPLSREKEYILKLASAKTKCRMEKIQLVLDTGTFKELHGADHVMCNQVADCVIRCDQQIAFDRFADHHSTGRFVIVEEYRIAAAGIVL